MRILLLQSSAYVPSLGGANKANRLLLEQLAARGHDCRVVGTAGAERAVRAEACLAELAAVGVEGAALLPDGAADGGVVGFRHAGVTVEAVLDGARLRARAARRLAELAPDRVLVSSEDPAQMLLREAVEACAPRVVYIAHTTLHLPFGPDGFLDSQAQAALLRRAGRVWAVSGYVRNYLRRWAGVEAELLHFPSYGEGPFPDLGAFDRGYVTLINPCAVKGIAIFLELTRRLPGVEFAAVPTWGTTAADRAALAALPNVRLLPPTPRIDDLFARTRVLLVPSLWGEAFGQVAVEAMLRGVPVLASDAGGLPEATLGVNHVLPVRPITRYEERFDERKIPVAVVPEQDVGPWQAALERLLAERTHYEELSRESRRAALAFVAGLGIGACEELIARPVAAPGGPSAAPTAGEERPLRILLVQPLAYFFAPGGAHKANRRLVQGLAARGHRCWVVAPRSETVETDEAFRERLAALGAEVVSVSGPVTAVRHEGVEVHAVAGGVALCAEAVRLARELAPDWAVVSEDSSFDLFREVLAACPERVVCFAHSPATLPFGPASFAPDPEKAALVRRARGVLTVSRYLREYVESWGGVPAEVVYSPVYGDGPFRRLPAHDRGFVTTINPSAIKGISIFAELARRLPEVPFAAVPTWSTTAADRELLAALPNVELLPAVDDLDDLFARTRVLVVPSLWGEAFGQVAVEAMLRGVPVLASDQGGLPEACLGAGAVLPVNPIERYEGRLDDRRMPVPVVPPQDVDPWEAALRRLLSDREAWERASEAAHAAAVRFVAGLGIEPYERWLRRLGPARPAEPAAGGAVAAAPGVRGKLDRLSPEKLALLARRVQQKKEAATAALPSAAEAVPSLPRNVGETAFPLSFAQQRLWFLDRLEPGSAGYNGYFPIRLAGELDAGRLAAALDAVVCRHEVLRTTYGERDGEPVQVVHPPAPGALALPLVDLGGLPERLRKAEAGRIAALESRRPFDLERGPVMRAALLRLGTAEHLLLIVAHHIAVDHWSAGVLLIELSALYGAPAGRAPALPELAVQYADFAAWQRGWLAGPRLEGLLAFWRESLAGAPALLELPTDRPRPARQSFRGARARAVLPPALAAAVRALARQRDATPYMLLLAAFQVLLHRCTGQDDLVVGTPIAGRVRPEVEPLIGFFVNTLALRGRVAPERPFTELVDGARRAALDAFLHQELPFEALVDAVAPERSLSHAPLFQVLFNVLNVPPRAAELGGLRLTVAEVEAGTTRFDLELYLEEQEQGLVVALDYATDLFDAATAGRLLRHLGVLLDGIAGRPDEAVAALPFLTPGEVHQLLAELDDTAAPLPAWTVPARFAAQAARTPDAPAVVQGEDLRTYGELAAEAARLARRLAELGVGPEVVVAVSLPRTPALAAALLGVLATGGAYVPLDPAYPGERLAAVLEDSRPRVLVTTAELADGLFAGLPAGAVPERIVRLDAEDLPAAPWPATAAAPENLAYVLFTSGSTGRPKGVEVPHGALANFLASAAGSLGLPAGGRLLAVTSVSFDIAALDLFLPLLDGGCVELATAAEAMDGAWLAARLDAEPRIDALQATPATWRLLLEMGWSASPGLVAMCGGETFPRSLASAVAARSAALWNFYGPTEATVWSSCHRLGAEEAGPVSIGLPLANVRQHVLDAGLRPVPLGVPGELYVAGAGLARGYRGRPDLTAERFVPDPLAAEPGSRLYRTGDLARWFEGGRGLEVMGRLDHQVKVRGFRIEPGEIEAALARQPGVAQAVVVAGPDPAGGSRLTAWVVRRSGQASEVTAEGLREALARLLPEPMVPARFGFLDALPLTPNGKIDRRALAAHDAGPEAPAAAAEEGPRTPAEELLAGLFADLLCLGRPVGRRESFFALGGHSLLAARLASRLRRTLGVELPLRDLFEAPTVAALAARIEALRGAAPAEPIPPVPRDGDLPLSLAQERLWFLAELAPGSAVYNLPLAVELRGRLAPAALAAALGGAVCRHEALRTTFASAGGRGVQRVRPPAPPPLPLVDLTCLGAGRRAEEEARLTAEEAERPFDLGRGPVLRALLLRSGDEEHRLLLTVHHIVADGWSLAVLGRELRALYGAALEGRPWPRRELPDLPVQYGDYAVWQRGWMAGERLESELGWWRERLAGAPPELELPTDRPRPPVAGLRGATLPWRPAPDLGGRLRELARREGVTPFMVLMAGFAALLHRHAGQRDLVVGYPVANRRRPEVEGLVGFFANTLPLRTRVEEGEPFAILLGRVREAALAGFEHQEVPFERLVEALAPRRDPSRNPLFQVMLVLQEGGGPPLDLPGLSSAAVGVHNGAAKFDLTLLLDLREGGLTGEWELSTDLFDPATVARLGRHLEALLGGAAAEPGRAVGALPLLAGSERHQIVREWNDTAAPLPELLTLHGLFATRAAVSPDAVAATCGGESLTYRELDERSGRLARRLAALGVGPGTFVAVLLERSLAMLPALLGVLKAGGAYVPLEPGFPRVRIERILSILAVRHAVAEAATLPLLEEIEGLDHRVLVDAPALADLPAGPLPPRAGGEDVAYAIFTSGSTGTPKGVVVRHRAAANLIAWINGTFGVGPADRVLFVTSLCFDLSVYDVFGLLAAGGSVRVATEAEVRDPERLLSILLSEPVTFWDSAPAMLEQLTPFLPEDGAGLAGTGRLRLVFLSGDWIPVRLPGRTRAAFPGARVVALGGATEATVWSNSWEVREVDPRWRSIPYGRPGRNARYHVVDPQGEPAPAGVPGDLLIGGECLFLGYAGDPAQTAEKLIPDPFAAAPGGRLYRTGDRARHWPDGTIEFLGRADHQVKVRGYRIELGEIEAVLGAQPAVREAAVLAVGDDREAGRRLVAYAAVAPPAGERPTADALRDALARELPAYMVPAALVLLEALPLTPNGKIDRAALARLAPEAACAETGGEDGAPASPVEELVAGLWADLLGRERVGRHDDFFALGGHSLLAVQVASRLRTALGVEVPLRLVLERPTAASLAAALASASASERAAGEPPLARAPRDWALPLSFAQQRLWYLDRLDPGSPAYNVAAAVRLEGELDAGALAAALAGVAGRHEVLRTTFPTHGDEPVQAVAEEVPSGLPLVDLSGLPEALREAEGLRRAGEAVALPFDLAQGPLVRALLVRLAPAEHALLVVLHHIVADGWSAGVLMREVAVLYSARIAGEPSELPELPVQYGDFAVWQRRCLTEERLEGLLAFWRGHLAGAPALLDLPADRPRPAWQSFRGARAELPLPAALAAALRAVARRRDATPYMLLLAAFQALLHRYTGACDLVVGSPVAGRTREDIEPLIGFFVNTLPLRGRPSPELPFEELADAARRTALDAFAHQEVPFERLVDALAPERSPSHAPVFQVLFNHLGRPPQAGALPGLRLSPVPLPVTATRYDLELYVEEGEEGSLRVDAFYGADLFDAATAHRLLRHYGALLAAVAERPSDPLAALPLLSPAEAHQLRVEANDAAAPVPADTVPARVAAWAERAPEAPAVAQGGRVLTYQQLAAEAGRLARHLGRLGVEREGLVAVALPRLPEMVVALLAVQAAGGAYLPLDPDYPRDRLALVLEDARPRVLITTAALAEGLLANLPGDILPERVLRLDGPEAAEIAALAPAPLRRKAAPEELAYVLFTSGSTGRPKGVEVPRGALANFLASMAEAPSFPAGGRLLALTSLSFDIAALELFLPLLAGGCVELATGEQAADGAWLAARLAAAPRIDALQATPATWRLLLEAGWPGAPDLLALCGGEALPRPLAGELAQRCGALWNLYGPTETTVWSAACRIGSGGEGPVSIGRPVANTRLHVLDGNLRPVPQGAVGELWIGGAGVARGYRGRPGLTAERFVPDPFAGDGSEPGTRLYRTGDLARRGDGGRRLEVLGRVDHQVKVRGFRIELGEIEAALARHLEVTEAVAAVREGEGRGPFLAAWFVPAAGHAPGATELRSWLARTLPEYMIPAAFVPLPELPLTPNRKVDRRALPDPGPAAAGAAPPTSRAGGPIEEAIAGIWADVLGGGRVGLDDDFFALGGHSLLGARVAARIGRELGVELPVRALFEAPTPAALARRVEEALRGGAVREPVRRAPRDRPLPLSFPQQRLWYYDQLHPGSAAYNLATAVRLEGELDAAALAAALDEVIRRHEVLRTAFPTRGDAPVQAVAEGVRFRPALVDLEGLPAAARRAECLRLAWEETQLPFDLARGPLLRAALLRLGPCEHALLLTLHHIVGDAWSLGVLVEELGALYDAFRAGRPSPLPELPLQYADFAAWQHEWLEGAACARDLAWWRERLAGAEALEIPSDLPRRAGQPIRPARQPVALPSDLAGGLAKLARGAGATTFLTLLAGFVAVLGHHARSEDVVVGSNVAGRNRPETEGLIGFFVNLLVLRADLSGDPTFLELLRRVRGVALEAWVHQDLPFDRLVQELGGGGGRDAERTPLFQAKLDLLPALRVADRFSGLRIEPLDAGKVTARYDLHLELTETPDGVHGWLLYDASLFEAPTAALLAWRFERLLREAAAGPDLRLSELRDRLAQAEREQRMERRQMRERFTVAHLQQIRRRPAAPGVLKS